MASTAMIILFALFGGARSLGLRVDTNGVTVAQEKDTENTDFSTKATPAGYTHVGAGACLNSANSHGTHHYTSEKNIQNCAAQCDAQASCTGFDDRDSGCLWYSNLEITHANGDTCCGGLQCYKKAEPTPAPAPAPASEEASTTACEYSEYLWERVSTENGHAYGQLSEFKVFDAAGTQLTPTSVTAIDNSNYHSEGPEYIFDGDLNTKYQDHGGSASPGSFMFSFSSPVKISSYEWFTPNDGSERDINSWALKGRNSGETQWTELHSVTDYAVTDNRKSQVGPFSVECASGSGSGSAAKGDPHLMNLKGEAFDVMQTGNMMLLEIPRGSSPATLDLALHADIERLGVVSCGPTFITKASVAGRWIGVPLEIRSGPIAKKGGDQPKHTFAIRFDGNNWLPHDEMQTTIELSKNATITAQDRMFLFQVRGLDIAVSQPKRPRTFLDIQVKGLGNLKTEIGGLLGVDDHSSVEELPSECEVSASSLSLAAMKEDEALQWSARALL